MKKYSILILVFLILSAGAFAQTVGNFISATLELGSQPNSVYVTIKSNTTITGAKFSSFQFSIGVLASTSPSPTATVTAINSNISYAPVDISTETQSATSFKAFTFLGDGSQGAGAAITYTAGMEYRVAEVFFTGGPLLPSTIRIMQQPNGGTGGNVYFYAADRGFDVTNQPAQFYSLIPANVSNDGTGYTGSSFATATVLALPVKLTGFSVVKKGKDASLSWAVESQDANSSHFELERGFTGTDFTRIGRVEVDLTTGTTASYNFNDVNIEAAKSNGLIFYRLKMVDKDGKFTYSQVRSLKVTSKRFGVNLYPNPAKGYSNVSIELNAPSPVTLNISDAEGKIVQKIEFSGNKGLNQRRIDLSRLAGGSYLIKVKTDNEVQTIPLVKE